MGVSSQLPPSLVPVVAVATPCIAGYLASGLLSNSVSASHLAGGMLNYRCIPCIQFATAIFKHEREVFSFRTVSVSIVYYKGNRTLTLFSEVAHSLR